MFKLFWNTANNSSFGEKVKETSGFEWKGNIWGEYHKNNSDKWIFFLLKKVNPTIIKNLSELKEGDKLIIIDSSIERKINFYSKLNILCSKIYLFHLGDEVGLPSIKNVYDLCNYSWRIFCTNQYFDSKNVTCIPLGYKSGVNEIKKANVQDRKYKWAFTGTVHKSSRHDLLYQLQKIQPYFIHKTEKFAEKKSLDPINMSKILSDSQFIPCPNGVVHPETYRIYEALECGCIPIVEKTYNYYDRLFSDNPLIKISKWIEAKEIIHNLSENDIEKKQEECREWWSKIKEEIQNNIFEKISND